MKIIKHYKDKRIININTNIIIASIASIFLASYPIHLTTKLTHSTFTLVILAFLIDGIIDIGIFFSLHYATNYLSNEKKGFIKDIKRIQTHRIFLSVLFFILAVSLDSLLMFMGLKRTHSFVISYSLALITTRLVHTLHGINRKYL